jgi:hypothetical protein|nr:MAG TPA: hypothetical protein [Caudoviricetes sp.]
MDCYNFYSRRGGKSSLFFLCKYFIVIYLVPLQYEQNSRDND